MNKIFKCLTAGILLAATLVSCTGGGGDKTTTTQSTTATTTAPKYNTTPQTPAAKALSWETGQAFPTFKSPTSKKIDAIYVDQISDEEKVAFTCLMGLVNSVEIRMAVVDGNVSKWLTQYKLTTNPHEGMEKFDLIKKYAPEISGVVLYSTKLNKEYMNLACTVANIKQAIPITEQMYKLWIKRGIELPVVADLTDLTMKKTVDIYQYLYDNYWQQCDKRFALVQRTELYQMRDLAAATGSACLYLSCAGGEETALFKKFLKDMKAGESILSGWIADQERELMTVAAQCGLSCVPGDFFSAPTLFSQDIAVDINPVPDMPELENKIYIAFYFSDGDNIQYNQAAMRDYWSGSSSSRGEVAINWTISPALVDIAPGMMNYYYNSATDKECFVCGPSGMGYTMPMNTWGANTGNNFRDNDDFEAYVKLTDNYLMKSGLRVVTIWDNLSKQQREIYTSKGTYLYGITTQHFTNGSLSARLTGVVNDMLIQQMTPGYFASNAEGTTPLTDIQGDIKGAVSYQKYDGTFPVFVATQVSVWAFHSTKDVINLEKVLSEYYEKIYGKDVVEFVRADHYYNLYYEANGLPMDVTMKSALQASATSNSEGAALTVDGTYTGKSIWTAAEAGEQSLTYELGAKYALSEIQLIHAEANGLEKSLNTKAFKVEVSNDGSTWTKVAEVSDNTSKWSTLTFAETEGSYVRITITDAGSDGIARIADVNIFGKLVK